MALQPPKVDDEGRWHFFNGDLIAWPVSQSGGRFTSAQLFKAHSPHTGVGYKATATPPYHVHLYQTETFDVKEGTLCYLIDGETGKLQPGEKVSIPPSRPHTFWNDPSTGTDLYVHITVQGGPNAGFDEDFVRNFYGYLSSVILSNSAPNPLQMFRLLDEADVVVIPPVPLAPNFVKYYLGRAVNLFFGRLLGRYIFRLPSRFKEFSATAQ